MLYTQSIVSIEIIFLVKASLYSVILYFFHNNITYLLTAIIFYFNYNIFLDQKLNKYFFVTYFIFFKTKYK